MKEIYNVFNEVEKPELFDPDLLGYYLVFLLPLVFFLIAKETIKKNAVICIILLIPYELLVGWAFFLKIYEKVDDYENFTDYYNQTKTRVKGEVYRVGEDTLAVEDFRFEVKGNQINLTRYAAVNHNGLFIPGAYAVIEYSSFHGEEYQIFKISIAEKTTE